MTNDELAAISVPIYESLKAQAQLCNYPGTNSTGLLFKAETFYSAVVKACRNAPPKIVYLKEGPEVDKPQENIVRLDSLDADAIDALIKLGFKKSEAMIAAERAQGETLEEKITNALKELAE